MFQYHNSIIILQNILYMSIQNEVHPVYIIVLIFAERDNQDHLCPSF